MFLDEGETNPGIFNEEHCVICVRKKKPFSLNYEKTISFFH